MKTDGYLLQFKAHTSIVICVMVKLSLILFRHNLGTSFCNMLSLLDAALIWPNRNIIWLCFFGLLGFFVSQNDYLYLSSKSVKGAVVTSIEQCHCGFPLPLTSELCWFLQGLASFRVHCRCFPLMGCGSVSSAKLLATFCHYRVDHCLLKKHPLCTYSNLMLWDNGLGDLGTASKRKNQPKKTPNPEGYV